MKNADFFVKIAFYAVFLRYFAPFLPKAARILGILALFCGKTAIC